MSNPFPFSNTNKRYYTYDYYLKSTFGCKVAKVALDAGFTCPNRDGKVGIGGCIFCNGEGSGEFSGNRTDSLAVQFNNIKQVMQRKWPKAKFIPYLQAFTNTYAPLAQLKTIYEPLTTLPDIVGLAIATRPDCLPAEVLDYLDELNQRIKLYVELGLQTTFDETALAINRGYPYATFVKAVQELRKRHIDVIVHLINGLPNETPAMMLENIQRLNQLDIQGVKLHSLNILKDTKLATQYAQHPWPIMSVDEYTDLVVAQLEHLRPNIIVERISGDAKRSELIAPAWSIKKTIVANTIDKKMAARNVMQGDLYQVDPIKLSEAVAFSHQLILDANQHNLAIDATLGNGHDSLFLVQHFNYVYAFDIQALALRRSQKLLNNHTNIQLIQDSYENFDKYVKDKVDLILYNLGFLPGSNHKIRTQPEATIASIKRGLQLLSPQGQIIVVAYTQHDQGAEYQALQEFLNSQTNIKHREYSQFEYERIIVITKK